MSYNPIEIGNFPGNIESADLLKYFTSKIRAWILIY